MILYTPRAEYLATQPFSMFTYCTGLQLLPLQVMLVHIVLSKSLQPNARVSRSSYSRTSRFHLCGSGSLLLRTKYAIRLHITFSPFECCSSGLATSTTNGSHITPIARCALCYRTRSYRLNTQLGRRHSRCQIFLRRSYCRSSVVIQQYRSHN